jgi:hypothetical protein
VADRGEDGGDAVSDQAQVSGVDQAGAGEVVGGALVVAAAAVKEQVGLGAQLQLRSACGHFPVRPVIYVAVIGR